MVYHQHKNSLGNFNYGWHFYKDTAYPPHFHRNLEAVYVLEGQVEMTIGGKPRILNPGDWALVLPFFHSGRGKAGGGFRVPL